MPSYLFRASETEDGRTRAIIGGKMTGVSKNVMQAWMLELLLICLRWENRVVGPRTLVSGDSKVDNGRRGISALDSTATAGV